MNARSLTLNSRRLRNSQNRLIFVVKCNHGLAKNNAKTSGNKSRAWWRALSHQVEQLWDDILLKRCQFTETLPYDIHGLYGQVRAKLPLIIPIIEDLKCASQTWH